MGSIWPAVASASWALAKFVFWSIALVVVLIVAGCGGGVGGVPGSALPIPNSGIRNPQPASALTYAYYGSVPGMIEQVVDHVTAVMVPPWTADQAPYFRAAHAAGLKIIWYPMPAPDWYQQAVYLDSLGLLTNIAAIYPCDEPDINVCPDPAEMRRLQALFPALSAAKLAVIYSASGRFPSIEVYDWVGVDDYGAGVSILATKVADLRTRLRPDQKLILVPGGADPWRTPPLPFFNAALADDRVAMVMPFVWFDRTGPDGGAGINRNGLADQYRAIGLQIKQLPP